MSDYLLETGAVILLAYVLLLLDGVVVLAMWQATWFIAALIPPLLFLHWAVIRLWRERPSA